MAKDPGDSGWLCFNVEDLSTMREKLSVSQCKEPDIQNLPITASPVGKTLSKGAKIGDSLIRIAVLSKIVPRGDEMMLFLGDDNSGDGVIIRLRCGKGRFGVGVNGDTTIASLISLRDDSA
jgi:hypothetical protein